MRAKLVLAGATITLGAVAGCGSASQPAAPALAWPPGAWTVSQAPAPADAQQSPGYGGIACPAAGACMLAGDYVNASGRTALLVETASRAGWTTLKTPPPPSVAGFPNLGVVGLACPAPGDCVIAADSNLGSTAQTDTGLIYTLSQGAWTTAHLSLPPDAGNDQSMEIDGVTCPDVSDCVAVGEIIDAHTSSKYVYLDGTQAVAVGLPVIATFRGGAWTVAQAPLPAGAQGAAADLYGVDCAAPGSCVAVGTYAGGSEPAAGLIETLANGAWKPAVAPLPSGANGGQLSSVACPAVGSCVAVGLFTSGPGEGYGSPGLIETQLNGTWRVTPAPEPDNPRDPFGGYLSWVACPAPGACVAVGGYVTGIDVGETIQAQSDTLADGTWTAAATPLPADASSAHQFSELYEVACARTGNCVSVGDYDVSATAYQTFIESAAAGRVPQGQGPASTAAAAELPSGQGRISIQTTSTIEPTDMALTNQVSGIVDGLPLTGTATLSPDWNDYCFGSNGSTATGTLGGIPFTVTMTCGPPGSYKATYTGEWGGRAINMASTSAINWNTLSTSTTLTGTIGSQHVTATVVSAAGNASSSASPPGGVINQVTGTITVS